MTKKMNGLWLVFALLLAGCSSNGCSAHKDTVRPPRLPLSVFTPTQLPPPPTHQVNITLSPKEVALARSQAMQTYETIFRGTPGFDGSVGASGVRIRDDLVLTCFHVLETDLDTRHNLQVIDEDNIVGLSPGIDLLLFRANNRKPVRVALADKIEVGEIVVSYSSSAGVDGVFKYYWIAKVTSTQLSIGHFGSGHVELGESGSALWNLRGQLVGIVNKKELGGYIYGYAIPSNMIGRFLDEKLNKKPS